jgi:hypothetical protein
MSDADPKIVSATDRADRSPAAERTGALHKVRRYAHRRWPMRFSDPDLPMHEGVWRDRDAQENEETEPPPDERVDLLCVWATEYYTPAHIGRLLQNLAALGWDNDEFGRRDAVRWIRELRERALGSGYFPLHAIVRPDDKRSFSPRRNCPLPDDVDYATGTIFSITSSITCVSIQFILRDSFTRRVNEALRTKYETRLEPLRRGYGVHHPLLLKRAAVDAIRAEISALAADWFRTHLPGVFAAGLTGGEFPTCEFMMLRVGHPFTRMADPAGRAIGYLDPLDVEMDTYAWQSERVRALKFSELSFRQSRRRFHAVLAANEADLPEDDLKTYGGRDRSGLAAFIHDQIKDLLPVWGLVPLT